MDNLTTRVKKVCGSVLAKGVLGSVCMATVACGGGGSGGGDVATTALIPPASPTSAAARATSSGSIEISWVDRSNNESEFAIERFSAGATTYEEVGRVIADQATYEDRKSLAPDTSYTYRVKARNAAGESTVSNTASARTGPPPPARPLAPTRLDAASLSATTIDLDWVDESDNEIGFRIQRATSLGGPYVQVGTANVNARDFRATRLSPETLYYFRVLAYNNVGSSDLSNVANARTRTAPLNPPSSVRVSSVRETTALLAWTDNSSNETGFEIGRCTGPVLLTTGGGRTCTTGFLLVRSVSRNVTQAPLAGLNGGMSYQYFVRAVNGTVRSANQGVRFTTEAGRRTTTLYPNADSTALNASAATISNRVYPESNRGLEVGCNWVYIGTFQTFVCAQSVVRFDTSSLNGREIERATLRLRSNSVGVGFFPRNWFVSTLSTPWNPNTYSGNSSISYRYYTSTSRTLSPPRSVGQVFEVDVTVTVQAWASRSNPNYGFWLQTSDVSFPYANSLDAFGLHSRENGQSLGPQLVVTYR